MQPQDNLTPAFKTINLIYMALGIGMIVSVSTFYFLVSMGSAGQSPELSTVFTIVVPVVGIGGFGMGRFLYGINAKKSKAETDELQRLAIYRATCLIVWATLEAPALFAGVVYFLTGDALFLAFFAMIFAGFVFSRPSIAQFQQDF